MALHTSLPVYKVAYDLLSVAVDYVRNMPRSVKDLIGGRVRDLCLEILLLIFRANCAADKPPYLSLLLEYVEELNLLLRLCQDKRYISKPQYSAAIALTASVGKQVYRWREHYAASPVT